MSHATRRAGLSLGANLGDRLAALRGAVAQLAGHRKIRVLGHSSVYETTPVGLTDQPNFLNAAILIATQLTPEQLLQATQAVEAAFGRERSVRWGPRTLDIDILVYEGEVRSKEELQLPHPRMRERAFVMVPWRELLRTHADMPSEWVQPPDGNFGGECAGDVHVFASGDWLRA